MQPLVTFGVGMVGAVAPEVVRLYSLRTRGGEALSWFYFVISFVFAALGGVVALILPATTLWGAFYAGISTPMVVSTTLKKGVKSQDRELRNGIPRRMGDKPAPVNLITFLDAL